MSVLIEDSPRNLSPWIIDACTAGTASGAVMTPFATPWEHHPGNGQKPSLSARADRLTTAGVPLWFDPTTHALQMGGVGDFRFYDEYNLWAGPRGDVSTVTLRQAHIQRVFQIQKQVGATPLAPTILLHHGLSITSQQALEIAEEAISQNPQCWLAVAGTSPFWSSGSALDAHIGALAQLEPAGWFLTVARTINTIPTKLDVEEVHGLCRTTRALSEDSIPVHISHGDLAALPAVAAGATTVGSGWDKRQRACSYGDYAARTGPPGMASWLQQTTLRGLVGSISGTQAQILEARNPALVHALGGLPAPAAKERYLHHLLVLSGLVSALRQQPDPRQRVADLHSLYVEATTHWPEVQRITGNSEGARGWVAALDEGLRRYWVTEGW